MSSDWGNITVGGASFDVYNNEAYKSFITGEDEHGIEEYSLESDSFFIINHLLSGETVAADPEITVYAFLMDNSGNRTAGTAITFKPSELTAPAVD